MFFMTLILEHMEKVYRILIRIYRRWKINEIFVMLGLYPYILWNRLNLPKICPYYLHKSTTLTYLNNIFSIITFQIVKQIVLFRQTKKYSNKKISVKETI